MPDSISRAHSPVYLHNMPRDRYRRTDWGALIRSGAEIRNPELFARVLAEEHGGRAEYQPADGQDKRDLSLAAIDIG